MRKTQAIIAVVIVFMAFMSGNQAIKAIGPVHIELNDPSNVLSAVANTAINCKIQFRFNVDIRTNDWIKVWFPIDEASCNGRKICKGMPPLNGKNENSRFSADSGYFKKFPNSGESHLGKIYEITDREKGTVKFYSCNCSSENCCPESECRIVRDVGNLGCVILGTVLPSMPFKEKDRQKKLAYFVRSISVGYTPMTESKHYPILKNTCKERSVDFLCPYTVEAYRRGYNPIDINFSKSTGIIFPSTTGTYRLMVATQQEPSPVESEIFVLPCSQVTTPKIRIGDKIAAKPTSVRIDFNLGEVGSLDATWSKIYLKFPNDFQLPKIIEGKKIQINGKSLAGKFTIENGILTVSPPANINNKGKVEITISKDAGIVNPGKAGKYQIEVWTSSEPDAVKSEEFEVAAK